jgi:hypothetical protein
MCLQNTLTCIVCLSVDTGFVLDYVASGGGLIEQLKRIWKEAFVACSRYYPGICLERLKKPAIYFVGELLVTICWVLRICFRIFNAPSCLSFKFISDIGVEYNVRLSEHSASFIPFGVEGPSDGVVKSAGLNLSYANL